MSMLNLGKQDLRPLSHFPLDEAVQSHIDALQDPAFIQEMDNFYLQMLDELEPAKQKQTYLDKMEREIQALYRINGVMVAILFNDNTVEAFSDQITETLSTISNPVCVSRISYILHSIYHDRLSVEYFSADRPSYADLTQGYLYNDYDLEAGLKADMTTLDEKTCEWLQLYQGWLQDYLYFNLAQISKEYTDESLGRMKSLSPLHSYLHAENQLERIKLK